MKITLTSFKIFLCRIAEELFYYNYPFLLPDFFRKKNTKDEFEVQFEILKVFLFCKH